jgi:hypothetical protein
MNRREFMATGAGGLAALAFRQEEAAFVVHEWGVATIMNGSTAIGAARSEGATFAGGVEKPEELPKFVETFKGFFDMTIENWKNMPVRKPIVYFYAKKRMQVDVRVSIPRGRPHAWWPLTGDVAPRPAFPGRGKGLGQLGELPKVEEMKPENGMLHWPAIVLDPATALPQPAADGWWPLARKTASTPVVADTLSDKFLFYDALTFVDAGLDIEWTRDGKVKLAARSEIPLAIAVRVKEGACSFAAKKLAKGESAELAPAAGTPDLVPPLVAAGLFKDEAAALAEIWKEEFFQAPGARVLAVVPRAAYDALLPIEITPKPDKLERVLIAHVECLDPDLAAKLDGWIAKLGADSLDERDAAAAEIRKLGPLAEKTIRAAAEKAADADLKGRLVDLLKR